MLTWRARAIYHIEGKANIHVSVMSEGNLEKLKTEELKIMFIIQYLF